MKQSRHLLQTSKKERATAVVGVVLVHAGVLAALLTLGGGPQKLIEAITPLEIFDVLPPPPPPPPPPPVVVGLKIRRQPATSSIRARLIPGMRVSLSKIVLFRLCRCATETSFPRALSLKSA